MRILLIGKNGQVGTELQRALALLGEVTALDRHALDLDDPSNVEDKLAAYSSDVIINAAAYTAVDKAESDRQSAFRVNAESVSALASHAYRTNQLLINYSTDYIFDGNSDLPYSESDTPNPQNVYGESKLAGELKINKSGCKALIFRTSWVISRHGSNFVKTMLRLGHERDTLSVVADQRGAPTSAELISNITALALQSYVEGRLNGGTYHLTAAGETTWHGLATHVLRRAIANGISLKVDPSQIRAIMTAEYPVPAKRPHNSSLNSGALADALGVVLPDWHLHATRIVDQLTIPGFQE